MCVTNNDGYFYDEVKGPPTGINMKLQPVLDINDGAGPGQLGGGQGGHPHSHSLPVVTGARQDLTPPQLSHHSPLSPLLTCSPVLHYLNQIEKRALDIIQCHNDVFYLSLMPTFMFLLLRLSTSALKPIISPGT